jgi:outer membrane protein OmpA-like peptidoglycan-associated protein
MRRLSALLLLSASACAPLAASPPADSQKFVVFFSEWSADPDPGAVQAIKAAARFALQHPDQPITVAGFADPAGSPQADLDLSRTRALVVSNDLVANGVPASRIQRSAHGATAFNLSSLENRRVDIAVGSP